MYYLVLENLCQNSPLVVVVVGFALVVVVVLSDALVAVNFALVVVVGLSLVVVVVGFALVVVIIVLNDALVVVVLETVLDLLFVQRFFLLQN